MLTLTMCRTMLFLPRYKKTKAAVPQRWVRSEVQMQAMTKLRDRQRRYDLMQWPAVSNMVEDRRCSDLFLFPPSSCPQRREAEDSKRPCEAGGVRWMRLPGVQAISVHMEHQLLAGLRFNLQRRGPSTEEDRLKKNGGGAKKFLTKS